MKLSKLRAANSHRMVVGSKVPKTGVSGFAMKRASGGACESVEGEKPKMRLDRPQRVGGEKVKNRADGGGVGRGGVGPGSHPPDTWANNWANDIAADATEEAAKAREVGDIKRSEKQEEIAANARARIEARRQRDKALQRKSGGTVKKGC